jgi:uncharacterized protein YcaQ
MTINLAAARNIHLAAQGLLHNPTTPATKEHVLATIRAMGVLQIDTINVVARSPYLVLWSRLGDYPIDWLNQLLEEKQLFEYWSHEASFLPIEHFGRYRHQMISPEGMGWKFNQQFLNDHPEQIQQVLKHIQKNGASRSADFERKEGKSGGWWEWKPEKRALEVLFTMGELMVSKRHNFQRVYDLRERVYPTWKDKRDLPNPLASQQAQVLDAIRALGIAKSSWVADYFRMGKLPKEISPETLAKQGLLITTEVKEWAEPLYIHPDNALLLQQAKDGILKSTSTRILSPFDPVVWDRKRALELFDFDYKLECYTPAAKRRYGYFTQPILRRGALIGRMDTKAHRKEAIFEIKALHLEPEIRFSQSLLKDLFKAITQFAQWHNTPNISLGECHSEELKLALENLFK